MQHAGAPAPVVREAALDAERELDVAILAAVQRVIAALAGRREAQARARRQRPRGFGDGTVTAAVERRCVLVFVIAPERACVDREAPAAPLVAQLRRSLAEDVG